MGSSIPTIDLQAQRRRLGDRLGQTDLVRARLGECEREQSQKMRNQWPDPAPGGVRRGREPTVYSGRARPRARVWMNSGFG